MQRPKWVAFGLVAAMALLLALPAVASADEGPHGRYGPSSLQSNTDKCAACHRAHTALNSSLLVATGATELCAACHGPGGLGADTNVWDGRFMSGRAPNDESGYTSANADGEWLNGGGFLSAYNLNAATFATVISRHDVAGVGGSGGFGVAFGGGPPAAGYTGISGLLECISCHDPHGSRNYRLLHRGSSGRYTTERWSYEGADFLSGNVFSNEIVPSGDPGGKPHDYTGGLNVAYDRGISDFCASCHTNYVLTTRTDPDGQQYDAGDGKGFITRYRHPVSNKQGWDPDLWGPGYGGWTPALGYYADSGIPATATYRLRMVGPDFTATNGSYVTCLSCHFAHGSSAVVSGYASSVAPTYGSALLFLDNRGVCQNCHGM